MLLDTTHITYLGEERLYPWMVFLEPFSENLNTKQLQESDESSSGNEHRSPHLFSSACGTQANKWLLKLDCSQRREKNSRATLNTFASLGSHHHIFRVKNS